MHLFSPLLLLLFASHRDLGNNSRYGTLKKKITINKDFLNNDDIREYREEEENERKEKTTPLLFSTSTPF